MKKVLVIFLLLGILFGFSGCGKLHRAEKDFLKLVSNAKQYKAEGVMESYYDDDVKQNNFEVLYKSPDLIKVKIKTAENNDQQIILKNKEGVYILVPAVNRNFKIQSSWPENASYPYLLQSLAKDIVNDEEKIKTVEKDRTIIETKTKMHANANPTKQKIIFDNSTSLPKEVQIMDSKGDLHMRIIFQKIDFDHKMTDDEFDLNKSMEVVRLGFGDDKIIYDKRSISYPAYYPEGTKLVAEDTIVIGNNEEVRSIMKFTGEYGFTIIQEFINDLEVPLTVEVTGDFICIYGLTAIVQEKAVQFIYEGVEYVLASNDLHIDDMLKIGGSFTIPKGK